MSLTPPLKWHGGKHYLADQIIALMPRHLHYVEPFFGGGAVLLHKNPDGVSEVVNDINRELTNFWRVLQYPGSFERFKRRIEAVPFSEIEWKESERGSISAAGEADVEAAIDFFIRARQSRQGLMKDFATLSRNRTRRNMNEQVSAWLTAIEGLSDVHRRLSQVVVLTRNATEVIRQQDGKSTLFYCDPPYLHETRVTTSDYAFEMTIQQHRELLATLGGIKGYFLLSGYPSALYEEFAQHFGWNVHKIEIDNKASGQGEKPIKTECVWMNF